MKMKRKNILVLMISLSLVLLLGSSYAFLRSTVVGNNSYVINVGTLEVTFVDSETEFLNLSNMYPMTDEEGKEITQELVFQVKNTGNVDSYYDVTLEETSTNPEFKSVIRYIINKDDKGYNEPKTLGENKYIELGGYLKPNESSSYKVKVWLDYNADNTYMNKEFKAKVVVNSFQKSDYAKDVIKSKLVKYEESSKDTFTGGLVAVNTDGDLYNETDDSQVIREYRYSGQNVNNYVTFNDEVWRIIGVFTDENNAEHVKIVRNEELNGIFPETYTINETEYKIKGDFGAYWNMTTSGYYGANWATAGLQYWLNTIEDQSEEKKNRGYLSYLNENSVNMIKETKYYLGAVTNSSKYMILDTPQQAYINERAIDGCVNEVGPTTNYNQNAIENNNTCRVWVNFSALWEGKIALLYPSDIGFASNASSWSNQLLYPNNNWIIVANQSCLLSPVTNTNVSITQAYANKTLRGYGTSYSYIVLPTLYLKSNVKITSGDGTSDNAYNLCF